MHPYRTHTCNELRPVHAGQIVRLSGWVFHKRDHGGILFIDLRDHYGRTQVIVHPSRSFFEQASNLHLESVITVTGKVVEREPAMINHEIDTGAVELVADEFIVESESELTPIYLAGESSEVGPEELRFKYRYLDLRRESLHRNIVLRSEMISFLRSKMESLGFREYQTPILTSSSPEGARDFLVPSRIHPGRFYALPQAPQIVKQLLMVAGFDRYFQIAPCFRDEDARADRSPGEFYQLDCEMSYVTQDDVFAVMEEVIPETFRKFAKPGKKVFGAPFPRIPYREAMLKYGSDKPDLRNPIEMFDVTDIFAKSGFGAFAKAIAGGAVVRAIPCKGIKNRPRSFFDKMEKFALECGAKGLGYLVWDDSNEKKIKGPIAKFLTSEELGELASRGGMVDGDVLFFMCDKPDACNSISGKIRTQLGETLDIINKDEYRFCWIVDFPFFETDPETGAIIFSHNPFSMPQGGMDALLNKDPLDIVAYQYDIVCNGIELSSGAVRNHRTDIMLKAFSICGYPAEEVYRRFPALANAFQYGAPPHAGIAPGVDRMVMLLTDSENIREVIAFPMNGRAQDLMMNAPSPVTEKQLRELHIKVRAQNVAPGTTV